MQQSAIDQAMAAGLPVTCATCYHYHRGNPFCDQPCGGPGMGLDFPCYNGPIPKEKFVERCLICGGDRIAFHIILGEGKTKYSLCKKHSRVYAYVGAAEGKVKHPVTLIAVP